MEAGLEALKSRLASTNKDYSAPWLPWSLGVTGFRIS